MLSEEQIKQFQAIYKQRFGQDISAKEARESGEALLELLKLIYKPIKILDLNKNL